MIVISSVALAATLVAPSIAAHAGSSTASGRLMDRAPGAFDTASDLAGTGLAMGLEAGVRVAGIASLHGLAERTWFSCGSSACDASAWAFGGVLRGELPLRVVRPVVEVGLVHRQLFTAPWTKFSGTSASFSRDARTTAMEFTGREIRVGVGIAVRVGGDLQAELLGRVSFGSFSWFSGEPHPNLDPNVAIFSDGEIPSASRTTHAFLGVTVGVRYVHE